MLDEEIARLPEKYRTPLIRCWWRSATPAGGRSSWSPGTAAVVRGTRKSRCPWDTEERRPSHADQRKALQRLILREEIRVTSRGRVESEEFSDWAIRLLD